MGATGQVSESGNSASGANAALASPWEIALLNPVFARRERYYQFARSYPPRAGGATAPESAPRSAMDGIVMLAFAHEWLQNRSLVFEKVFVKITSCRQQMRFIRVAASSNSAFEATCAKRRSVASTPR